MSSSREKGEDCAAHFDFVMYSSTCSLCAPQYTKISSTPALAKNSNVYSMSGVLARGSRHYAHVSVGTDIFMGVQTLGRSSVKGLKRVSKGSASI
jgi:hypothetical protein